jgi:outer membrane lipoprotein-sorting protein
MYNERKNKIPGLMEGIWKEAGVSCEVLVGGVIRIDDAVTILDDEDDGDDMAATTATTAASLVDPGRQAPGYYTPPSQRTAHMVREARSVLRATREELWAVDPDGVSRTAASYASVGLQFWPPDRTTQSSLE